VTTLLLFLAAAAGGALNSVAGGGSFFALPALLYAGVAPVAANATSTLALWPGSVSSAFAYRRELRARRHWLVGLGVVSLLGGLIGGVLLVRTSDTSFMRLLPWLMLLAATTFTFGKRLREMTAPRAGHASFLMVIVLQFFISIYGGYFGGGMGIMMLAVFALAGMTEIHEMNGLKSLLGVAINTLALGEFIVRGAVAWRYGLLMVVGSVLGGYLGASGARVLNPKWIRLFVIVMGWSMTFYFFLR
jgi:hypothetical protein